MTASLTLTLPSAADLRGVANPLERLKLAGDLAGAGRDAVQVRDAAILELLRAGYGPAELGRIAGVSKSQMSRYVKAARG